MLEYILNEVNRQVQADRRRLLAKAITGHQVLNWGKITSGEKLCLLPEGSQNWSSYFSIGSQSNAQERDFLICKLNTSLGCRTPSPFMGGHLNSHFKMVCLNNVRIRAQMSAFNAEEPLGKCGWRDLSASHNTQRTGYY